MQNGNILYIPLSLTDQRYIIEVNNVLPQKVIYKFAPEKIASAKEECLKEKLLLYVETFTIHGLSKTFIGHRVERYFWLFLLSVSLVYLSINLSHQVKKYFEYNVYTYADVRFTNDVTFPSVTVCDRNAFIVNYNSYCGLQHEPENTNVTCGRTSSAHRPAVVHVDEDGYWITDDFVFHSCDPDKADHSCEKTNKFRSLAQYNHTCITWNPEGDIDRGTYGVVVMEIYTRSTTSDLVVLAHGPNEYFDVSDVMIGTQIMRKTAQRITLKQHHHQRLPDPYPSKCQTNQLDEISPLFPRYSRKMCVDIQQAMQELRECGDTVDLFLPFIRPEVIARYKRNQTLSQFYGCRNRLHSKKIKVVCQPACIESKVEIQKEILYVDEGDDEHKSFVIFKLDSPDSIMTIQEKPLKEWEDMLSEVGGLMGLLVGASVCSAFEIIIAFGLYVYKLLYKRRILTRPRRPTLQAYE